MLTVHWHKVGRIGRTSPSCVASNSRSGSFGWRNIGHGRAADYSGWATLTHGRPHRFQDSDGCEILVVLVVLVFRAVADRVGHCARGAANRALVVPEDWTSDPAEIVFERVTQIEDLVFSVVLAEHTEVVLHFVASSLTQCRPSNQRGGVNVNWSWK